MLLDYFIDTVDTEIVLKGTATAAFDRKLWKRGRGLDFDPVFFFLMGLTGDTGRTRVGGVTSAFGWPIYTYMEARLKYFHPFENIFSALVTIPRSWQW